jgi:hypothetical protein
MNRKLTSPAPTLFLLLLAACTDGEAALRSKAIDGGEADAALDSGETDSAQQTLDSGELPDVPGSGDGDGGGDSGPAPDAGDADVVVPSDGGVDAGDADVPADDGVIAFSDTVHVDAERLYTLTRHEGLSIADVGDPDALEMLGLYDAGGLTGIAMYGSQHNRVIAIYHDVDTSTDEHRVLRSVVRLLDASDPDEVVLLSELSVYDELVDSRFVGDVLYAISGQPWDSEAGLTRVVAIEAAGGELRLADELMLPTVDPESENTRVLYATRERLYVAESADANGPATTALVYVLDISDASGRLVSGPQLEVPGAIEHAAQLNEHDGVLRVVSATRPFQDDPQLFVHTFDAAGAEVGALAVPLANGAQTLAAVFDGPRAYAATSDTSTQLFALDLSDAAHPAAAAALEVAGASDALVLRGTHLFALGTTAPAQLVLLDVAAAGQPVQLDQVALGGDVAFVNARREYEGGALIFVDEASLVAIPVQLDDPSSADTVRLLDIAGGDLVVRGSAPTFGSWVGAVMRADRLLVCSTRVRSFDLSDRDAPLMTSEAPLP